MYARTLLSISRLVAEKMLMKMVALAIMTRGTTYTIFKGCPCLAICARFFQASGCRHMYGQQQKSVVEC